MNTTAAPIVVGIDDSPHSYGALDWAVAEAVRRRLPLHLVHVVEWQPYRPAPAVRSALQPDWSLGSVSDALARHTGCPVAAVR
jgi:nucleotide-binding universal stress UspA family protein